MADRTVKVVLDASIDGFQKGMEKASEVTEKTSKHLDTLASMAAKVGAATAALSGLAVKSFADFDSAMSGVAAASRETGENLQALRDKALELGSQTAFSASQAAEGIDNLSRAGVATADILSGGIGGALDLAAAGAMEVGQAAEYAAIAMNQFKLKGSDVPHVADLLAAGAGKAMGDVKDFGDALKQSGLVASQFGLSIEETVGGLSAFAQAGLIGSDAGTSFKAMLVALANPAGKTAETMKEMGIAAYDANGNFIGLAELAGRLQEKLGNVSDATRQQALAQIFGNDALRAASILYEEGKEGIEGWIEAVDESGYAAEQARIMQDNLRGDLVKLGSAWGGLMINMGEVADGPLRGITQRLTEFVAQLSETPGAATVMMAAVTGLAGLGLTTAAIIKTTTAISEFRTALISLGKTEKQIARLDKAIGALGKAAKIGGLVAAGIAIVDTAAHIGSSMVSTQTSVKQAQAALDAFAESGKNFNAVFRSEDGKDAYNDGLRRVNDMKSALKELANEKWYTWGFEGDDGKLFGLASPYSKAADGVRELSNALAESGPSIKNAEAFSSLWKQMGDAGVSDHLQKDLMGSYLEKVRTQLEAAGPEFKQYADNADKVAEIAAGKLPEGLVYTTEGIKSVKQATAEGLEGLDQYGKVIVEAGESAEEASKRMQESADAMAGLKAEYSDSSRHSEMVRQNLDALTQSMAANEITSEDLAQAVSAADEAYASLISEVAQSAAAFIDVGGTIADFTQGAKFNLDGYLKALQEQVQAQREWQTNMALIADRVSQETLDELARLGPEGAPLVASLVTASEEQLSQLEGVFKQGGQDANTAWASAFVDSRQVWEALGKKNGQAAVDGAKKQLAEGKITLQEIVKKYDLNIKLDADTSPVRRSVSSIIGWIKTLKPEVQVGAYHKNGLNAPAASGGLIRHIADSVGLAGGGMARKRYPSGGVVHGPGTTTSDSVPAMLSRDEFVQRAAAVKHYGVDVMYALNSLRIPRDVLQQYRFATGGTPRSTREYIVQQPAPQSGTNIVFNITESARPQVTSRLIGAELEARL